MEREVIPEKPTLIVGLPDVGLVGVIATSHLVSSLHMDEVGALESELFPPIIVLHSGVPNASVRLFSKGSLVAIMAEVAIPAVAMHQVADAIVNWASLKGVNLVVSLSGMAVQERQNLDKPKVFAAISGEAASKRLGSAAEIMEEGYIVGPYALILKKCTERGIPAITLLAQSYYNHPDPEAAASTLLSLNSILGLNVDITELTRRGEEIRLRARDAMRRTQTEMSRMGKPQEYEVPPLYE